MIIKTPMAACMLFDCSKDTRMRACCLAVVKIHACVHVTAMVIHACNSSWSSSGVSRSCIYLCCYTIFSNRLKNFTSHLAAIGTAQCKTARSSLHSRHPSIRSPFHLKQIFHVKSFFFIFK